MTAPITNATSRGELVDRMLQIEALTKNAIAYGTYARRQFPFDILDIIKGTVTVTEEPPGLLPT